MVAVDTNIIVRLLTGDDPLQAAKAKAVFVRYDILIPETVILETEWVLRHAYDFDSKAIHSALTSLCGLPNVIIHNPLHMLTALQWYSEGMDFADALHIAASQECNEFFSFDRKLARKSGSRGACRVREP